MNAKIKQIRLITAGSRKFLDWESFEDEVTKYIAELLEWNLKVTTIVSGMARGPDMLGIRYARKHGLEVETYKPDWDRLGNRAGIVRNCEMARNAEALIAFWDGKSTGTKHMIKEGVEMGLETKTVRFVDFSGKDTK